MRLAFLLAVLAAAPAALAQDLLVVDPSGAGQHTTIQAAVNAAAPGDVIEVRPGTYVEHVTVTARALTLVAPDAAAARLRGTLRVTGLAAGETVLVSHLVIEAPAAVGPGPAPPPALTVESCDGAVRIQDCDVVGPTGGTSTTPPYVPGNPAGGGVLVRDARDVAFLESRLTGGAGGPSNGIPWDGGDGGHGLVVEGASRVLVQRCVVSGGAGADGESGGNGGAGAALLGLARLVIGYSAFRGADGGDAWNLEGGSGGDGMFVSAGAAVDDFAGLFSAGFAGTTWMSLGNPGVDGVPVSGQGLVTPVPAAHPSAVHAPVAVRSAQAWTLEVVGLAGERVRPLGGGAAAFRWLPPLRQPLMLVLDRTRTVGLGTWRAVPASGRVNFAQPPAALAAGQRARVDWHQAQVAGGDARLTSARALVVLE